MSRLRAAFERIRAERRTGLVTYTTVGDPDLARSADILRALDRAGADVLEVGVPFSDPLATIADLRSDIAAPIVVFSYANPLLRVGIAEFARRAAGAGVDGVLALDLPIEEAGEFRETLASAGIDTIFLLSPTTTDARIQRAAELGSGFLYGISRLGVTGARDQVASGADAMVRRIRAHTSMPIALGFGVSRPEHVAEIGSYADAAVVGSALVSVIAKESGSADLIPRVEEYVRWLKGAGRPDATGRREGRPVRV